MTDEPHIVLPKGCAIQHSSLSVYARTREIYGELCHEKSDEHLFHKGADYFSWNDKVNGIHWMVLRPSPELEEELDFENLRRRYRGR